MHFNIQTQATLTPVQDHKEFGSAPQGHRPHIHRNLLQEDDQIGCRHLKQELTKLSEITKASKSDCAIQKGISNLTMAEAKKYKDS